MTWFMTGTAALTATSSILGARSNAAAGMRQANAVSKAEGEAIVKERLNTTIRNSFNTAMSQAQLALRKRQLTEQQAGIGAAELAARGDADVLAAATGTVGGSVDAVSQDIEMKAAAAQSSVDAAYETSLDNYDNELRAMVLNTQQSEQSIRPVQYTGPSTGEIFGMGLLSAGASFASNYALRSMSLGMGPKAPQVPVVAGTGLRPGGGLGLRF